MRTIAAHAALAAVLILTLSLSLRADEATKWNAIALDAIRRDKTPPAKASRGLAMVSGAVFDAVNAIEPAAAPYLFSGSDLDARASQPAAAASAARDVLADLYPSRQEAFDQALERSLASIPSGPAKAAGISVGRQAASVMLAARQSETAGTLKCFALDSCSPLPPARRGTAYARMDAAARTADQAQIARFWAGGPAAAPVLGQWNTIAAVISARRGLTLSENARLFALLNFAMADAAIAAPDSQRAWEPPFAAAHVLERFFGTDFIAFQAGSDALPGVTRSFYSFSHAADESGMSRVYAGGDAYLDEVRAARIGTKIGRWTYDRFLTPAASAR